MEKTPPHSKPIKVFKEGTRKSPRKKLITQPAYSTSTIVQPNTSISTNNVKNTSTPLDIEPTNKTFMTPKQPKQNAFFTPNNHEHTNLQPFNFTQQHQAMFVHQPQPSSYLNMLREISITPTATTSSLLSESLNLVNNNDSPMQMLAQRVSNLERTCTHLGQSFSQLSEMVRSGSNQEEVNSD